MKKLLCLFLVGCMFLLTACNSAEPEEIVSEDAISEDSYTAEEVEVIEEPELSNEPESINEDEATFILNINSKKIHYPWCHSAKKTKARNKRYSTESFEDLIDQGYTACGNCDPS